MNSRIETRADKETIQNLEWIKKKLKISKSDVVRMAINHFKNYVEKVNK